MPKNVYSVMNFFDKSKEYFQLCVPFNVFFKKKHKRHTNKKKGPKKDTKFFHLRTIKKKRKIRKNSQKRGISSKVEHSNSYDNGAVPTPKSQRARESNLHRKCDLSQLTFSPTLTAKMVAL